jgi:hypothetical protein
MRDADEWQRWANLQVQEELCREMEALKTEENLEVAGRRMREAAEPLEAGGACPSRARARRCGAGSRTAQDEVFARTSAYLTAQNEEASRNLTKKADAVRGRRGRWRIRPTG